MGEKGEGEKDGQWREREIRAGGRERGRERVKGRERRSE